MFLIEDKRYSKDYLAEDKRSIANAVRIFFNDGTETQKVEVEYPIGHRQRRQEGIPLLEMKFLNSLKNTYSPDQTNKIYSLCINNETIKNTAVNEFMDLFVVKN